MKFLAIAVTVTLTLGAEPEVNVRPSLVMSVDQCKAYAEKLNSMPFEPRNDARGRLIIKEFEDCVPFDLDSANEQAHLAR